MAPDWRHGSGPSGTVGSTPKSTAASLAGGGPRRWPSWSRSRFAHPLAGSTTTAAHTTSTYVSLAFMPSPPQSRLMGVSVSRRWAWYHPVDTGRDADETGGSAPWGASCPRQGTSHPLRFVARRTFFQPGRADIRPFWKEGIHEP